MMLRMPWQVTKYVKANDKCPFDKWKGKLTDKDRSALDVAVLALESTDVIPPETIKKYLTTKVHEFKIKGDRKELRPLVEKIGEKREILIFCGAIEKDKIPDGDITTAENLLAEWKSGAGNVRSYWEN